jgi:hypothetical protein
MRKHYQALFLAVTCLFLMTYSHRAAAASMTLEQKYQDVFVSAGYATAMGAAVGAAVMVLQDDPAEHLRYVAVGASIGFFAGTAFGTYVVIAPSFAEDSDLGENPSFNYARAGAKERQLIVQPVIGMDRFNFKGLETGMILAQF